MGERYNGIVEVRGSIPLGSTIIMKKNFPLKAFAVSTASIEETLASASNLRRVDCLCVCQVVCLLRRVVIIE